MGKGKTFCGAAKLAALVGIVGGTNYISLKRFKDMKSDRDKLFTYYNALDQWVQNRMNDKNMEDYFLENNIHRIAIYGAGPMGRLLYEELRGSQIEVMYFIDKNAKNLAYYVEKEVITVKEVGQQEEVDAIVITPYYFYDEITENFDRNGVTTDTVSLEDIIYSINI